MPVNIKKTIVTVIILICSFGLWAQAENPVLKKLSAAALRNDFLLLKDTMQKIHPAMYRYTAKKRIDYIFDSCYATISDSISLVNFYLLTKFTVAAIGDGHANSKLSREVTSSYLANTKQLADKSWPSACKPILLKILFAKARLAVLINI